MPRSWDRAVEKFESNRFADTLNEAAILRNKLRAQGEDWSGVQKSINKAYGVKPRQGRSWYKAVENYVPNELAGTLNEAAILRNKLRDEGKDWSAIQKVINLAYGIGEQPQSVTPETTIPKDSKLAVRDRQTRINLDSRQRRKIHVENLTKQSNDVNEKSYDGTLITRQTVRKGIFDFIDSLSDKYDKTKSFIDKAIDYADTMPGKFNRVKDEASDYYDKASDSIENTVSNAYDIARSYLSEEEIFELKGAISTVRGITSSGWHEIMRQYQNVFGKDAEGQDINNMKRQGTSYGGRVYGNQTQKRMVFNKFVNDWKKRNKPYSTMQPHEGTILDNFANRY